jgi:hypothetical protein
MTFHRLAFLLIGFLFMSGCIEPATDTPSGQIVVIGNGSDWPVIDTQAGESKQSLVLSTDGQLQSLHQIHQDLPVESFVHWVSPTQEKSQLVQIDPLKEVETSQVYEMSADRTSVERKSDLESLDVSHERPPLIEGVQNRMVYISSEGILSAYNGTHREVLLNDPVSSFVSLLNGSLVAHRADGDAVFVNSEGQTRSLQRSRVMVSSGRDSVFSLSEKNGEWLLEAYQPQTHRWIPLHTFGHSGFKPESSDIKILSSAEGTLPWVVAGQQKDQLLWIDEHGFQLFANPFFQTKPVRLVRARNELLLATESEVVTRVGQTFVWGRMWHSPKDRLVKLEASPEGKVFAFLKEADSEARWLQIWTRSTEKGEWVEEQALPLPPEAYNFRLFLSPRIYLSADGLDPKIGDPSKDLPLQTDK